MAAVSSYPTGVDTFGGELREPGTAQTLQDRLMSAVVKIEQTLGISPHVGYTDVAARLAAIAASAGGSLTEAHSIPYDPSQSDIPADTIGDAVDMLLPIAQLQGQAQTLVALQGVLREPDIDVLVPSLVSVDETIGSPVRLVPVRELADGAGTVGDQYAILYNAATGRQWWAPIPSAGGSIPSTIVTAKGQIVGASSSNAPVAVPAPTVDGLTLRALSGQTPGVGWSGPMVGFTAEDKGLLAVNMQPATAATSTSMVLGTQYLVKVPNPGRTVTSILLACSASLTAPTGAYLGSYVGLLGQDGRVLGQATAWQTALPSSTPTAGVSNPPGGTLAGNYDVTAGLVTSSAARRFNLATPVGPVSDRWLWVVVTTTIGTGGTAAKLWTAAQWQTAGMVLGMVSASFTPSGAAGEPEFATYTTAPVAGVLQPPSGTVASSSAALPILAALA